MSWDAEVHAECTGEARKMACTVRKGEACAWSSQAS